MITRSDIEKANEALDKIHQVIGFAEGVCLANRDDEEAVFFLRDLVNRIEAEM
uniref:Uncharacterized protein n=1 Tax=Myoviridae sp. ctaOv25 TaxID=2827290 RepID=A0A8S5R6F5_9CAUD|nr:MAG TPA: hypothetical protein [Myoviridae sp. ctaOv25]